MATNGRRRTKGAGSIIHRKDGSWEFRREVGRDPATGKRRYVSAKGRTKAGARERFDARIAEMERTGLLPGAKSPYLKDYAERWLEEYRLNVKPTTYRTRAGRIHACMEVIGCVRLTDLTPDHVRQCMRVLSKRLAPSTLKDHFVSLKMMLDQAELEELIPVDPCRRVRPPRVEPTETRILSPDQPKQLIEAVIPAWLKAEHLYGILWLTTPKTHAAHRFVPISTSLWQRLWARVKRLDIGPRELIFTNSRGNPVRSSTERHNWNKALKAAGLPPVTIHSARHWTASMTARANMPDDARTAIMGHTSISMTNHYTHRDTASLAKLLGQAIPDLHDDMDVIDVQVIDEAA